jgi:hypothetical protein
MQGQRNGRIKRQLSFLIFAETKEHFLLGNLSSEYNSGHSVLSKKKLSVSPKVLLLWKLKGTVFSPGNLAVLTT